MTNTTKLRLNFLTHTGSTVTYNFNYSKDGETINTADVQYLLNALIANTDALSKNLTQSKRAAVIETSVAPVDIE